MEIKESYPDDLFARESICAIGKRMYEKGFVASNDGNISVRVGENALWMTPTGVSKGSLTPDMLIKLDLDGNQLAGTRKKSSEAAMHLRIYRENPALRAVTHAHAPFSTAFAVAGLPLDCPRIYPEALVQLGEIPLAPFAVPGTQEVPDSVAPFCGSCKGVLLANHGPVTWGTSPEEAFNRLEALENFARITLYAKFILGRTREISAEQAKQVLEVAFPSHQ